MIDENAVMTLEDENGEEFPFNLLGTVELDEVIYYALIPIKDSDEKDELIILKAVNTDEDDITLSTIDDDEELDYVFKTFAQAFEFETEE